MYKVDDLTSYQSSISLANKIWNIVSHWDYFARNSIGIQLVRSIDSIGANIAEGFGRYHRKDKVKFYYNARGSLLESQYWVKRAFEREIISEDEYLFLISDLRKLPKEINTLIKLTMENLKE